MIAIQLADSEVPSTRHYWRKEFWGMPSEIARDPRPLKDILGKWPDWRNPRLEDFPTTLPPVSRRDGL
jgi:hypothetical protein